MNSRAATPRIVVSKSGEAPDYRVALAEGALFVAKVLRRFSARLRFDRMALAGLADGFTRVAYFTAS